LIRGADASLFKAMEGIMELLDGEDEGQGSPGSGGTPPTRRALTHGQVLGGSKDLRIVTQGRKVPGASS
jgi:hypothetical protein